MYIIHVEQKCVMQICSDHLSIGDHLSEIDDKLI
jgi:hypothetical protein